MLLLISLLALRFAQPGAVPPQPGPSPTVLRGHFEHAPVGDTVYVWYASTRAGFTPAAKTALSSTGDFQLSLPNLKAGSASLSYARQRTALYLQPGDEFTVRLDFPRFVETVRYTGRGEAANNYLARSLYKFEYEPATPDAPRPTPTPTMTPAEMRRLADAFRLKQHAFMNTYSRAHPLPAAFARQAALDIDLQWGRTLLDYPGYVHSTTKQPAALPPTYFDFLKVLPLQKLDDQLTRENVLRFLSAYGGRLLPDGPLPSDPAAARRLYDQATADFGLTKARDLAMYQMLTFQPDAALLVAYPTFKQQNRDSLLGRNMRQLVRRSAVLQPGQPAPTFSLLDESGKTVSLSDFKGQVVYLDFWASWCGPCVAEAPAGAEMKRKFVGRDVVFLYVSIDRNPDDWRKALAKYPLTGPSSVHLIDQKAYKGSAGGTYMADAIPSYWLIGRDGRIRAAHAPRPSEGAATVAALEQALAQ